MTSESTQIRENSQTSGVGLARSHQPGAISPEPSARNHWPEAIGGALLVGIFAVTDGAANRCPNHETGGAAGHQPDRQGP